VTVHQPHPGINFSRLPVDGNAAGLLFVLTTIFILVGGLGLEWFFFGSVAAGGVIAGILILLHRYRPDAGASCRRIELGLKDRAPRPAPDQPAGLRRSSLPIRFALD
jgi:hypothetical protein